MGMAGGVTVPMEVRQTVRTQNGFSSHCVVAHFFARYSRVTLPGGGPESLEYGFVFGCTHAQALPLHASVGCGPSVSARIM